VYTLNVGKKILWGNISLFPYVTFSLQLGLPRNKLRRQFIIKNVNPNEKKKCIFFSLTLRCYSFLRKCHNEIKPCRPVKFLTQTTSFETCKDILCLFQRQMQFHVSHLSCSICSSFSFMGKNILLNSDSCSVCLLTVDSMPYEKHKKLLESAFLKLLPWSVTKTVFHQNIQGNANRLRT